MSSTTASGGSVRRSDYAWTWHLALARKLAGIVYAMWRDGSEFGQPAHRRNTVAA